MESTIRTDIEKLVPVSELKERLDGGYGWVMVFATFLFLFSTWGVNSAFGVYFSEYLKNNTFPGASRIDYAFIGGISFGVGLFSGPLVNYVHGILGTHLTILLGNCFQFTSIMLASWSVSLWQLYCSQGIMQSFGLALISLPALTLLTQWFTKRRALAQGLAVMGSGAGGVTFTMAMYKVMEVRNVHWALRAQAIISACLVLIGVALVRTRTKAVVFTPIDMPTLKCVGFWLLCFFNVTCVFGYVIILYTMSSYTTSLGYTQYQGAIVSTMVQVGFCFGRPLIGHVSDIFGPATITVFCYYMATIFTLAMWITARNYESLIMLALLEGTFIGAVFSTTAPIIVHLVGLRRVNVAFCMLWVFFGVASIFGEPVGVCLTDLLPNGNLDPNLFKKTAIFAGCSFFVCATFMLFLRGYLIARERIMEKFYSDEKSIDRLYVNVPARDVFNHLFVWSNIRA
jgi:MFS family permease